MKLSLSWIRDYVNIPEDADLKKLAYDLTMSTVEVEDVEYLAERFENMIVGVIEKIEPHPNADRLRVCKVNIGSDEAVVVPTPKKNDHSGGGETGGGSTGGGVSGGGGTTGSTVTANEKQFIIHLQDVSTKNSAPFANRKYHIQSGDNSFDVTSDENGDILLDISPKEHPRPNTVIGDTPTTITETEVPDGYQVIPSSTKIYINVVNDGDDYHLN